MPRFSRQDYQESAKFLSESFKTITEDMKGVAGSSKQNQIEEKLAKSFDKIISAQINRF